MPLPPPGLFGLNFVMQTGARGAPVYKNQEWRGNSGRMKQRGNETPRRENISSDRCSKPNVPCYVLNDRALKSLHHEVHREVQYIQDIYSALLTKLGSSTIRGNVRSRNRNVERKIEFIWFALDGSS